MSITKFLLAGIMVFFTCNAVNPVTPTETTTTSPTTETNIRIPIRWNTIQACSETSLLILYNNTVITILQRPGDVDTVTVKKNTPIVVKHFRSCQSKSYSQTTIIPTDTTLIQLN